MEKKDYCKWTFDLINVHTWHKRDTFMSDRCHAIHLLVFDLRTSVSVSRTQTTLLLVSDLRASVSVNKRQQIYLYGSSL